MTVASNDFKKNTGLALAALGATLAAGGAQAGVVTGSGTLDSIGDVQELMVGPDASGLALETTVSPAGPKITVQTLSGTAGFTYQSVNPGDVVGPGLTFGQGTLYAANDKNTANALTYGLRSADGDYGWVTLHDFSKSDPTGEWFFLADYDYAFQTNSDCTIAAGSTVDTCVRQPTPPSRNDVPEPGGLALVAAGLVAASLARRRPR